MREQEHAMYDTYIALKEAAEARVNKEKQITEQRKKEAADFYEALNKDRTQNELKNSELKKFSEATYDKYLQIALEAIYISALQKVGPLSESSLKIASATVANYIAEHGGASNIIRTASGRTFLLDYVFEAVMEAHDNDMKIYFEAKDDKKEDDDDDKKDDKDKDEKKDPTDKDSNESGEDIKLGDADGAGKDDSEDDDLGSMSDDDDKKDEDKDHNMVDDFDKEDEEDDDDSDEDDDKKEDKKDSKDDKDKDDNDDDDFDDTEDEEDNDDSDDEDDEDHNMVDDFDKEDEDSDPVTDEPDTRESIANEPVDPDTTDDSGNIKDSKEDMFEKLEDSEDVNDAVDIIARRISDAESEFIQKNAEDKQKIKDIVNRVDDRIKAVVQDDDTPEEKKDESIEAVKNEATRLIHDTKGERFQSVFENIVQSNFSYVMKNQAIKESYTRDNGKMDVAKIVESSRVMYGFLETINTLQLEKIDEAYILNLISNK